jgi:microcystin-dependent protein
MADDATNIHDLDPALPLAGGDAGEGDDEIRVVKASVRYSMAGNDGTIDWSAQPSWVRTNPDRFDATACLLGPRALNALPAAIDEVSTALALLDGRVDALETATVVPIPVGLIAMWSGLITAIPSGWTLCDGTAGTPDLRDRFIVAAGSAYAIGATGGAAAATQSSGAHAHTGATGTHALTVAEMPAHGHPYQHKTGTEASTQSGDDGGIVTGTGATRTAETAHAGAVGDTGGQQIGGTGGGQAHSHTLASDGAHTHAIDVRPAYYALAYIMYAGP